MTELEREEQVGGGDEERDGEEEGDGEEEEGGDGTYSSVMI
jgi:hypothetical protein